MRRHLWTLVAGVLVCLALVQSAALAILPLANQLRPDIEQILSSRLGAAVTISEIGGKSSLKGPYLEAMNLVVEHPDGRMAVRRVRMLLNVIETIRQGELRIDQVVMDGGELIRFGDSGGGMPDPAQWALLLDELHTRLRPLGAVQLVDFDVLVGAHSIKRLSLKVDPARGVLARMRWVNEQVSVPIQMDWRFPSAEGTHDLRVQAGLGALPLPETLANLLADRVNPGLDANLWLTLAEGRVTGQYQAVIEGGGSWPIAGRFQGAIDLASIRELAVSVTDGALLAPGLSVELGGARFQVRGDQFKLALPSMQLDGASIHDAFVEPSGKLSRLLLDNAPRVTLRDLLWTWHPERLPIMSAKATDFSLQGAHDIPEIGPVAGSVFVEGDAGVFTFFGEGARFALPDLFPEAWVNQTVAGALAFRRNAEGLLIRGRDLRVMDANQDVRGDLLLDLPVQSEQSLHIELTVDANHKALPGLLPVDLDPEVAEFLARGVELVEVQQGRITYSGPLGAGVDRTRRELAMHFPLADYRLKPLTEWPAFIGTQGVVRFADKRVAVALQDSDFGGLKASRVDVQQAASDRQRLDISGRLLGDAGRALTILDGAGLKPDGLGDSVRLDGTLAGEVRLSHQLSDASTEGEVLIEPKRLEVRVDGLRAPLTEISGAARYVIGEGLRADRLRTRLLGGTLDVALAADAEGVRFTAEGPMPASDLLRLADLPIDSDTLSGEAHWRAEFSQQEQGWRLALSSDGVGLESTLPVPLTKPASQPGALALILEDRGEGVVLNANLFGTTRIETELAQASVVLSVETPQLDVIGWMQLPTTGEKAQALSLLADVETVLVGDLELPVDRIGVQLTPGGLDVSIEGEAVAGRVQRLAAAPLLIELEHLRLPEGDDLLAAPGEDVLSDFDPGELPSAIVRISELRRGERQFRDVELTAVSGQSRLDVTRMVFQRDGQPFSGEMAWQRIGDRVETALVLRAEGPGLGGVLRVNESEPILESRDGRLSLTLSWPGSPAGFSVLTSDGQIELSLSDGRFVDLGGSAEVLRLFGILNIETLARRLRLDFLDLVKPGVAFDEVKARAILTEGQLYLDPALVMEGPSASFQLSGRADLWTQSLDHVLEVDIPLTNNLPLASVLLGAPQVGGVIYLVEKALGSKIIRVGKTAYRIEGSFDDPQIALMPPFARQKESINENAPANNP